MLGFLKWAEAAGMPPKYSACGAGRACRLQQYLCSSPTPFHSQCTFCQSGQNMPARWRRIGLGHLPSLPVSPELGWVALDPHLSAVPVARRGATAGPLQVG